MKEIKLKGKFREKAKAEKIRIMKNMTKAEKIRYMKNMQNKKNSSRNEVKNRNKRVKIHENNDKNYINKIKSKKGKKDEILIKPEFSISHISKDLFIKENNTISINDEINKNAKIDRNELIKQFEIFSRKKELNCKDKVFRLNKKKIKNRLLKSKRNILSLIKKKELAIKGPGENDKDFVFNIKTNINREEKCDSDISIKEKSESLKENICKEKIGDFDPYSKLKVDKKIKRKLEKSKKKKNLRKSDIKNKNDNKNINDSKKGEFDEIFKLIKENKKSVSGPTHKNEDIFINNENKIQNINKMNNEIKSKFNKKYFNIKLPNKINQRNVKMINEKESKIIRRRKTSQKMKKIKKRQIKKKLIILSEAEKLRLICKEYKEKVSKIGLSTLLGIGFDMNLMRKCMFS
jgi:hypothetical protein